MTAVSIATWVSFTSFALASGTNDTPSGASVMYANGSGVGDVNYNGDPIDWWVVTVSALGDLKFTLDVPAGQDFDLKIYNSSAPNGFIDGSYNGTGLDEEVTVTMTYSGPYYAKVYTWGSSAGSYTITNQIISLNTIPQTPSPISPADDAILITLTPYFEWSAFQHGGDGNTQNGYEVRVRCDTDGDTIVYDTGYISNTSGRSHTYSPGSYTGYDSIAGCDRVSNNLEWGKHYHWHARYRDSSGDWGEWSSDTSTTHQDFYTNSYPDVNIVQPADGATVSGTVTIKVDGWDNEDGALDKIEYYIDNTLKHTDNDPLAACPASQWDWDTISYSNGSHKIKAIGYDFNSWTDTHEINVTVSNNHAPTLTCGYVTPASGSPSTNFTFYVTYTDADGDAPSTKALDIDDSQSCYSRDMTYVSGNYTTGAIYKYETTLPIRTYYKYQFRFTDGKGGSATIGWFDGPTVKNEVPTVLITSPQNGGTVSGIVPITVEASDIDGVITKVEYYIDSSIFPTYTDNNPSQTCPSFSHYDWMTFFCLNGSQHDITVKAYDNCSGVGSAAISVIVDNRDYINISHAPELVVTGNTVTFNGTLTGGARANRTIYICSAEASLSDSVITDLNGNFTYQWTPAGTGTYRFGFGFTENACTFGDAFDVVTVIPGINNILSVGFTPSSASNVNQGTIFNLRVDVGLDATTAGVLQVWITGNGTSKDSWIYIPYSQCTIKQFNFSITAPSEPGTFTYNIYTQFRPNAATGPLVSSDIYDSFAIDEYTISTLPANTVSAAINIPQGISTFALPFDIDNKSIMSVFANNPPNYIYAWDVATSSYKIYPKVEGYQTFSSFELGKGYFVYSDNTRQLSLTGRSVSAVNVNLSNRWNFVSNSTGVDDLPILAVTINKNGESYSLDDAISAGIITGGIYELKGQNWQLAKFLKMGHSYYVYANDTAELVMNAISGPYLTSMSKDSFSGYVPANGKMQLGIAVPSGTTQITASISGSDASNMDLFLYDPLGNLQASRQGGATLKEIIIPSPAVGNWHMDTHSTIMDYGAVTGNVYINHPATTQYAMVSTYNSGEERPGWSQCLYGSLGYGDKTGATGLACDVGPNLLGLAPTPWTAVADEFVDVWQIGGSCIGPVFSLLIKGDSGCGDLGECWSRCWPNLFALIPIIGDSTQIGAKFVKQADNVINLVKTKIVKVVLKQGETVDNLPAYLKILHNNDKIKNMKGAVKFTDDEMIKIGTNENLFKGKTAEKLAKMFDEQFTTAKGVMKADIPPGNVAGELNRLGLQKTVSGKTLGIGSYDPKNWNLPAEKIFVKRTNGAIEAVGVGTDEVFMHEGKLYIKEVKNIGANEWQNFINEGQLDNLKDIQRTFDTEFPQWKAEVIVQSFGETPPSIIQAFQDAGIRLIKME